MTPGGSHDRRARKGDPTVGHPRPDGRPDLRLPARQGGRRGVPRDRRRRHRFLVQPAPAGQGGAQAMMTRWLPLMLLLLTTGCTSALAGMSPEQLAALARDETFSVPCLAGDVGAAKENMGFLTADKGVPAG